MKKKIRLRKELLGKCVLQFFEAPSCCRCTFHHSAETCIFKSQLVSLAVSIRQMFISKHLKGRSAPRVSDVFADSKDFVVFLFPDTFRIQGILLFPCFWTLSVFKGFCRFPVSRHFPYSKDFVIFLFPDSSVFKGFCHFPVSRVFLY